MITPADCKERKPDPKDSIYTGMEIWKDTELLKVMIDTFHFCADQCQRQIDFLKDCNEFRLILAHHFCVSLEKALAKIDNLLFSYQEHLRMDPYEVWEFILENQGPDCGYCGINIKEDRITIHIPCLEMSHRSKRGCSLVEKMLAALISKNIDRFPNWHIWKAEFYLVFPLSTRMIPRDVDNYNYKRIIDLIAFALGSSDNAIHFSMSMETIFTDKIASGVYIEITPRSLDSPVLPNW